MNWLLTALINFATSFAAIAVFVHYDLDDRWRLWKVKRGRQLELKQRMRDDREYSRHMELLEEERRREHEHERGH